MKSKKLLGGTLLMITAIIWGSAFVAQSVGMDYVGPYTFTAARSYVGAVVLIPVIFLMDFLGKRENGAKKPVDKRAVVLGGIACGVALCAGSVFQQLGMAMGTSPGKAGFITALYILIVPILGLLLGKKVRPMIWLCVSMSAVGLYLLCAEDGLGSVEKGDIIVIAAACCFACHIQIVDHFSKKADCVRMSCIQFLVAGLIATVPTLLFEPVHWSDLMAAGGPILYAGVMSSGVAYTLQIFGQRNTPPTVASMIMSMESVFAVLTGVIVLHQIPGPREVLGCAVMFAAIVLAQLPEKKKA